MPAKFKVKEYQKGGVYYIYNKGFEDRNVFEDEVDYGYWMKLMERYAGGVVEQSDKRYKSDRPYRLKRKKEMALTGEVKILAYCLMRQSIHMLVWQKDIDGVTKLMRRLVTNYTMYLNRRHGRRGKVFAGVYKGVLVSKKDKQVFLTRWIHRLPAGKKVRRFGPVETVTGFTPEEYLYSSYKKYLNHEDNEWFSAERILKEFEKNKDGKTLEYRKFVERDDVDEEALKQIGEFLY